MKRKKQNKVSSECDQEIDQQSEETKHSQTGKIILEGASMIPVTTFAAFEEVIKAGSSHRTTKSTKMNDVSSRSHCVLTLTIRQTHVLTKLVRESKINLVDLAGNERGNKSGHLSKELRDEAIAINLSLTALNSCFRALTRVNPKAGTKDSNNAGTCYVPYRDSPLTWILQDSLGGNAKTILLSTISPAPDNTHETLCTLRYAALAKEMPNGVKAAIDDKALRQEAEMMRKVEIKAKRRGMELYGLPEAHLELMHEFYSKHGEVSFKVGELISTTWQIQCKVWDDNVQGLANSEKNNTRIAGWVREWEVLSTSSPCCDLTEPRYVKVLPNETIQCRMKYSCENVENGWIQQMQLTVDIAKPVVSVTQLCGSIERNRQFLFSLTAPAKEGLYMIWWKGDLQYSLADAENNYPANYDNCDSWYGGFIGWLRVDPHLKPKAATTEDGSMQGSPVAKFLPEDYVPPEEEEEEEQNDYGYGSWNNDDEDDNYGW